MQDSLGIERYAIAAFALSSSGPTSISGALNVPTQSSDGDHLRVFVNNNDTLFNLDVPGFTSRSFNLDFGDLQAGDVIYVAVGPKVVDYSDGFYLNYQITQPSVPEPGSLVLFSVGLLGLGLAWYRRVSAHLC